MMLSANDCHAMHIQLPSTSASCISTISTNNYLERFNVHTEDFIDQSSFATNSSQGLDNEIKENNYLVQDQNFNVNVAFCVSTTNSANKISCVAPNAVYGKALNNNRGSLNQRRNQWKNRFIGNSCESDLKPLQIGTDRNCYQFPFNTNGFSTNSCDTLNSTSSMFCNTVSLPRHNSTNGHNKTKHYPHKKLQRYNHNYADDVHKRAFGLMERFKSMAKHFKIHPTFPVCSKSDPMPLDQAIWDLFISNAQTEETYMSKLDLWQKAYIHIGKLYARYALFMVGSTMSGLATQNSDIDMCLLLRSLAADPRHEAVNCLEDVRKSFINCDFVESVDLIQAKVPILKFVGLVNGFAVDLNYNNAVGIRNTHLLYCYVQLDWRVRPLAITVKLWAQANSINDAKHMTISSYSLALMVVHYLQCGTNPPLLPCLHNMYPDKFKPEKEIHEIEVQEKIPKYSSYNKQPLGELLMGFLHYYACFNYESEAISVRLGSRVSIDKCRYAPSQKNDIHQWKFLCIEEPFDLTNTARSVYDLDTFRRIQRVFQDSSSILWQTGDINRILKIEENQR